MPSVLRFLEVVGNFQNWNCRELTIAKIETLENNFYDQPYVEMWRKKSTMKKVAKMVKLFWMHAQETRNSRFFWLNKLFDIIIKCYCEFATISNTKWASFLEQTPGKLGRKGAKVRILFVYCRSRKLDEKVYLHACELWMLRVQPYFIVYIAIRLIIKMFEQHCPFGRFILSAMGNWKSFLYLFERNGGMFFLFLFL